MPSMISSLAPGIAFAVARPPDVATILSRAPWITSVGASIRRSDFVRFPVFTIAPSWRAGPAGLWPRS
jgi:hypothetical protein